MLQHHRAICAVHRAGEIVEGVGVVLVLHDLARAMNGADRAVVLEHGRIVADSPPSGSLASAQLAQTWGVAARWIGEPGQRALSLDDSPNR